MFNQLELNFSDNPIAQAQTEAPVEYMDEWTRPVVPQGDAMRTSAEITKIIEKSYHYFGGWNNSFQKILDIADYVLNMKEDEYMNTVNSMERGAVMAASDVFGKLLSAFCFDYNIWDYLGCVYQEIASISKSKAFGQFFTPIPVAEAMALCILGDISDNIEKSKQEGRRITVHDPACGSGALLLAAKRAIVAQAGLDGLRYFEFSGVDVDPVCVKMCRIQMTMTDFRYMSNLLMIKCYEIQRDLNKAEESAA